MGRSLIQGVLLIVNKLDQETAKRRGPTRAVEPFKKKNNNLYSSPSVYYNDDDT
jgi:hypothetical protein